MPKAFLVLLALLLSPTPAISTPNFDERPDTAMGAKRPGNVPTGEASLDARLAMGRPRPKGAA